MCGIVAGAGIEDIPQLLLNGLARLEYRGYDSAGIAVLAQAAKPRDRAFAAFAADNAAFAADNDATAAFAADNAAARAATPDTASAIAFADSACLLVEKRLREPGKGMIALLGESVEAADWLGNTTIRAGIGHTRWATHGAPSVPNAHPQLSCDGRIAVVHNGIIENYDRLKAELIAGGHTFVSETDTEVVAHLLEQTYAEQNGDLPKAVRALVAQLSGSFALAILHSEHPDTVVVTRNDSPLVIGCSENGAIAASDVPAIIEFTRDISYINDRDIAVLHADGQVEYFDPAGEEYIPGVYHVEWDIEQAEKGGYPDFMLKEIHEQPRVIRDTMAGRYDERHRTLNFAELPLSVTELAKLERIYIVACGTSYHAGLIGKDVIETWARIPVEVEVASEFRYRNPIITPDTLVIAISQSGETADTLEAVRMARLAGAHVVGITNVVGSRITSEVSTTLYVKANLEIAVAATKSFLAQVVLLTLFALYLAQERQLLTHTQIRLIYQEMLNLPEQIEQIFVDTGALEAAAKVCSPAQTALFIGRGLGATTCFEGALKLKEISYMHAEAFAAGEIKHGPIALIDPKEATPVIAVATQSPTREKMLTNIEEVKARGAYVVALGNYGDTRLAELADQVLYLPPTNPLLAPITASVVLQLFAREIAILLGCDVDQPRNLAKSVTVE